MSKNTTDGAVMVENRESYFANVAIANQRSPRKPNSASLPPLHGNPNQPPPSPCPSPEQGPSKKRDRLQYDGLVKGFTTITVAGAFIATIQAQIMGNITGQEETAADRAISILYIGGLLLDIMAACLAFLTARWLERLRESEKNLLEKVFSGRPGNLDDDDETLAFPPNSRSWSDTILYTWLGGSLFSPMLLLFSGFTFMVAGIYTSVWAHHSTVVAILITLVGAATLPFVVGDFFIGRKRRERRAQLIFRLSEMQGNW
ncbi:hypothetical protein F5148DRAFT_1216940 [Russula earlei]|uniref:Uncharacterized protein n=1 Tax=Russula earlei TaxID=71964 RepID=A0ACC0U2X3_9AGAM|nr:hypothetical protein F5148DRAFT_1216940 [Russula earlei]